MKLQLAAAFVLLVAAAQAGPLYNAAGYGYQPWGNLAGPQAAFGYDPTGLYGANGFYGYGYAAPAVPAVAAVNPSPLSVVNEALSAVPYGADYVSPDGLWPRYHGYGLFNQYGAFLGRKK